MLRVLRASEREHAHTARGAVWTTRHTERTSDSATAPDPSPQPSSRSPPQLRAILEETHLPRGMPLVHSLDADRECLSYVRAGRMSYRGPAGQVGVLSAGEFHVMTLGPGDAGRSACELFNQRARVFTLQLWVRGIELEPLSETRRITVAERRGALHLVASPGGRAGSVAVRSAVDVYSAVLRRGSHIAHEILPGRSAWLHVIDGAITIDDVDLRSGDGVGVSATGLLALAAATDCEVLLIEFHADAS